MHYKIKCKKYVHCIRSLLPYMPRTPSNKTMKRWAITVENQQGTALPLPDRKKPITHVNHADPHCRPAGWAKFATINNFGRIHIKNNLPVIARTHWTRKQPVPKRINQGCGAGAGAWSRSPGAPPFSPEPEPIKTSGLRGSSLRLELSSHNKN